MPEELYQQCMLVKDPCRQVAWIESKFAVKNKILKVKTPDGWEDEWKVDTVFGKKITRYQLELLEKQHKGTRKVSDV